MKKKIQNKTSLMLLQLIAACFLTHNLRFISKTSIESDCTSVQGLTTVKNGQHQ